MTKIEHVFTAKKEGRFGKLLEHLRYSGSTLLSWSDNENVLTAKCLLNGTKKWFEMTKRRAESFTCVEVKEQ